MAQTSRKLVAFKQKGRSRKTGCGGPRCKKYSSELGLNFRRTQQVAFPEISCSVLLKEEHAPLTTMSAQSVQKGTFSPDSDVHVTREDQGKINKFARLNANLQDLQDEIKNKENAMKNLEDASDELLMVDDESELIPFMVADVFFHTPLEDTKEKLEAAKEEMTREMEELNAKSSRCKEEMAILKRDLYAKFGENINLEPDEE